MAIRYGGSFPGSGTYVYSASIPSQESNKDDTKHYPVLTGLAGDLLTAADHDLNDLLAALEKCPPPVTEEGMRLAVVVATVRERRRVRTG